MHWTTVAKWLEALGEPPRRTQEGNNNGSPGSVDSVRCAGMRSPSDKGTWRAERREAAGVATSGSSARTDAGRGISGDVLSRTRRTRSSLKLSAYRERPKRY